jgi:hypothetical protein
LIDHSVLPILFQEVTVILISARRGERKAPRWAALVDYDWPERKEMQKLRSRLKGGCGQDWPPHILVLFREIDAATKNS